MGCLSQRGKAPQASGGDGKRIELGSRCLFGLLFPNSLGQYSSICPGMGRGRDSGLCSAEKQRQNNSLSPQKNPPHFGREVLYFGSEMDGQFAFTQKQIIQNGTVCHLDGQFQTKLDVRLGSSALLILILRIKALPFPNCVSIHATLHSPISS